ncbi:hypothetical protein D3C81_569100 [compost metagenome]
MGVTDDDLYRCGNQDHPHGHRQHLPDLRRVIAAQQVPGCRGTDKECRGQERGQCHVHQAIGEGGVEDDLEPVHRCHPAIDDFDPLRRLHPAVGRQDPEHRDQCANSHHHRGKEMQASPYPVPAEQHHPEEAGFEEERREHLVGQQGAGNAAGKIGEACPVGAELVGHDQARDHAHAKVDGKDFRPEMIKVFVDPVVGLQPATFEHSQKTGQADGDGRENDVERDRERELNPRQVQRTQSSHEQILRDASTRPEAAATRATAGGQHFRSIRANRETVTRSPRECGCCPALFRA